MCPCLGEWAGVVEVYAHIHFQRARILRLEHETSGERWQLATAHVARVRSSFFLTLESYLNDEAQGGRVAHIAIDDIRFIGETFIHFLNVIFDETTKIEFGLFMFLYDSP